VTIKKKLHFIIILGCYPKQRSNTKYLAGKMDRLTFLPLKRKPSGIADHAQANSDSRWAHLTALDTAVHSHLASGDNRLEAAASSTIAQLR
jgi:hypothetical protein